ncbi:type II secretion system F family protein [Shewanella marina]|uniref:type II secretion system F family protein n=1 Tax=Shewanella marina TaxID=487319 RepID=UPI000560257C|nr:type II secretion system F family protein [Shewanella marina]
MLLSILTILLVLLSGLIAWQLTLWYRQQAIKAQIKHYLNIEKERPLSRLQTLINQVGDKHQQEFAQQFAEAGFYNFPIARYYLVIKFGLITVMALAVVLSNLTPLIKVCVASASLVAIIIVPNILLDLRKRALITKVSRQLPYMLDMMAVCVQTGMTLEASLTYLGKELEPFDKDLCFQIRKTATNAHVKGLEKALMNLSERLPTPEVRSFVLTLIQNLQYGTSISNVLSSLAKDMRKMQLLEAEEKMGKLSAKMSVPLILFILMPIVVLILGPGIMQLSVGGVQ